MRVRWFWLAVLIETALWSVPVACFWALWRLVYGAMPADIVAVDVLGQHLQFPRGIEWWWSCAFIVSAIFTVVACMMNGWKEERISDSLTAYKLHEAASAVAIYAAISTVVAWVTSVLGFAVYPIGFAVTFAVLATFQETPREWKLWKDASQPHGENMTMYGAMGIATGLVFALLPATLVAIHDSLVLGVAITAVSAFVGMAIALIVAQPIYWARYWYWKRYTAPKLRELVGGDRGMERLREETKEAMRRINDNDPIVDDEGNSVVE